MKRRYYVAAYTALFLGFLALAAFASYAHAAPTVCQIFNGCTGTSTAPSNGKVPIGDANGNYEFVFGTSLGPISSVFGRTGVVTAQTGDYTTSQVTEGSNLYFTNGRAVSALTGQNVSLFTNDAGYLTNTTFDNRLSATTSLPNITTLLHLSLPYSQLTGTPLIASSTLLGDSNTFSGVDKFTNGSSDFSGTWQTFSPSHFQTALGFTPVPNTRNVNTTYPLAGGGALSGDLTLTFSGLATTSPFTAGQLAEIANNNTVFGVSTTSISCSGNIACTGFTALGAGSTISFTGTLPVASGGTGALNIGKLQLLATDASGNVISTSTPTAAAFFATSTSLASQLPYASTTMVTATTASTSNLVISGIGSGATKCLHADQNGSVSEAAADCGSGAGSAYPFIDASTFGTHTQSTTTAMWFQGNGTYGIFASSTSVFNNATTSQLTVTGNIWHLNTKNALQLTDANGLVTNYGGASACSSNNFVTTISATGGTTCGTASVTINTNSYELSGGGSLSLGGTLNLNASTSPTFGYVTATSTSIASNFPYASTTMITATTASSTNLTVSGIRSALHLADANGIVSAYGGSNPCSNQVALSISASGVISCTSVTDAMFSGSLSVAHGGTGASSIGKLQLLATDSSGNVISTSTPTAAAFFATSTSLASQFPYASTTMLTATTASTTNFIVSAVRSALHVADANGVVSAFGGSNCGANTFANTINANGSLGCTSVPNAALANSSITINTVSSLLSGGGSVSLGGTLNLNASTSPTVGYVTATSTSIASQLPYASTTMTTATLASTTNLNISGIAACNTTQALTTNSSGVVACGTITATASPGGSDKQIQFNDGGSTLAGAATFVWNKLLGLVGIGSTTPSAMLSIASSTYDYKTPVFLAATSSDPLGTLFSIFGTSSTLATNISGPDSGARVGIGTSTYEGSPGLLDQLIVNGRVNTENWFENDCYFTGANSTSIGASNTSNVCSNWGFFKDNSSTFLLAAQDATTTYYQLVDGSGNNSPATANNGIGIFVGANSAYQPAVSTPVLEAVARIENPQQASSSNFFIGFDNTTPGTAANLAVEPTAGCYFVASTTLANWQAQCRTSMGNTTTVDTGVASTTNKTATGKWYQFRLEFQNGIATFYIASTTAPLKVVAVISTNVPSTTLLNVGVHLLNYSAGLAKDMDIMYLRLWVRRPDIY